MTSLLAQARELGAVINSGSLCLPADALANFLSIATNAGWKIRYIECLYFHEAYGAEPKGTEPCLELSRDFVRGQTGEEFIAEASRLSSFAIEHAARYNIQPYFQVGLEPELDASEANIRVRR